MTATHIIILSLYASAQCFFKLNMEWEWEIFVLHIVTEKTKKWWGRKLEEAFQCRKWMKTRTGIAPEKDLVKSKLCAQKLWFSFVSAQMRQMRKNLDFHLSSGQYSIITDLFWVELHTLSGSFWQHPTSPTNICQISFILSCWEMVFFEFLVREEGWQYTYLRHNHASLKLSASRPFKCSSL